MFINCGRRTGIRPPGDWAKSAPDIASCYVVYCLLLPLQALRGERAHGQAAVNSDCCSGCKKQISALRRCFAQMMVIMMQRDIELVSGPWMEEGYFQGSFCRLEDEVNGNPTIRIPRTLAFFPTQSSLHVESLHLAQLSEVILWVQNPVLWTCKSYCRRNWVNS